MTSSDVPQTTDYAMRFQQEHAQVISALRNKLLEIKPAAVLDFKTGKFGDLHFANRELGLPVVASIRVDPRAVFEISPQFPTERRQLFDDYMTSASAITVHLEEYRSFFASELQEKVCAIPNAVPAPRQLMRTARRRQIVCVARLSSEKNPQLLAEAFAPLIPSHPDWVLKWVGGDYYGLGARVQKRIDALGAHDNILLAGESRDVEAHLAASSIFAFPSRYEGWGNAAAEAMAAGVPVVALESCAAMRFFIQKFECGLLSEPSVEDFRSKLEALMNHEDLRLRLGDNGRRITDVYTPERMMAGWNDVLHRLGIRAPAKILLFYEKFQGFLGGIERSMAALANGLRAGGYSVEMLLTRPADPAAVDAPYSLDASVRIHNLHG